MFQGYNTWKDVFIPGQISYNSLHITDATEQIILNNCHTMTAFKPDNDITLNIAEKYQFSDIYSSQKPLNLEPGAIQLHGNGTRKERYIVNMFTQKWPEHMLQFPEIDRLNHNLDYFKSALNKVYMIENLASVAFAEKLCCNGAQINCTWPKILQIFQEFAEKFPRIRTVAYVGYFFKNIETTVLHNLAAGNKAFLAQRAKSCDLEKEKIWRSISPWKEAPDVSKGQPTKIVYDDILGPLDINPNNGKIKQKVSELNYVKIMENVQKQLAEKSKRIAQAEKQMAIKTSEINKE